MMDDGQYSALLDNVRHAKTQAELNMIEKQTHAKTLSSAQAQQFWETLDSKRDELSHQTRG